MKRLVGMLFALFLMVAVAGCGASKAPPVMDVILEQSGKDLVITVQTTNWQTGKDGHIHVRLDDGPEVMSSKPTYTIGNVAPGKHKVFVELSDTMHKPMGVSQTREIEIAGAR